MDSLDCKYYEPDLLDVKYDYSTAQNYEQNPLTATPSSEDLDQELESLLLLMGESNAGIQDESTPVYDDVVAPTVDEIEWLNADELVDPKEFNYQVPNHNSSRFDYPVSRNNNLTTTYKTTDRYNYQANSTSYNYSPSDRNNYSYQASHSSSKFDYQSDQDSSSKFSHVPTANNDRFNYQAPSRSFDYQPTNPTKFDRSIPTFNRYPSVPCNNNSSQSRDQSILDVEVDQNTQVRLEVGASASAGDGSARAAAYAKATIYRRG